MTIDGQSGTEAGEYLEKMSAEYRYGCFSEKKPDVCHLLGDYLESVKKDYDKARKIFRSTCDDYSYAKSCMKYGNYAFIGKGKSGEKKGDPGEALKYYEKGCSLNDPVSCLHSGLMYVSKSMDNTIIERNVTKGVEYLNKSCDLNNASACFYLSGMYISGVEGRTPSIKKNELAESKSSTVKSISPKKPNDKQSNAVIVKKDMEKAFSFAYKSCELKNMYACANLSQMYSRGEGTEKSDEKAEKFKKMATDMQQEIKTSAKSHMDTKVPDKHVDHLDKHEFKMVCKIS